MASPPVIVPSNINARAAAFVTDDPFPIASNVQSNGQIGSQPGLQYPESMLITVREGYGFLSDWVHIRLSVAGVNHVTIAREGPEPVFNEVFTMPLGSMEVAALVPGATKPFGRCMVDLHNSQLHSTRSKDLWATLSSAKGTGDTDLGHVLLNIAAGPTTERKVELSEDVQVDVRWEWQDIRGSWHTFSEAVAHLLEQAFLHAPKELLLVEELLHHGESWPTVLEVDFLRMQQRSVSERGSPAMKIRRGLLLVMESQDSWWEAPQSPVRVQPAASPAPAYSPAPEPLPVPREPLPHSFVAQGATGTTGTHAATRSIAVLVKEGRGLAASPRSAFIVRLRDSHRTAETTAELSSDPVWNELLWLEVAVDAWEIDIAVVTSGGLSVGTGVIALLDTAPGSRNQQWVSVLNDEGAESGRIFVETRVPL